LLLVHPILLFLFPQVLLLFLFLFQQALLLFLFLFLFQQVLPLFLFLFMPVLLLFPLLRFLYRLSLFRLQDILSTYLLDILFLLLQQCTLPPEHPTPMLSTLLLNLNQFLLRQSAGLKRFS